MSNLTINSIRINGFSENSAVLIKRFGKRFGNDVWVETSRFYEPTLASMNRFAKLVMNKVIEITKIDAETGEMTLNRNRRYGFAPVTFLHRDDIKDVSFSIDDISDADLVGIAEAMGNMYTGSGAYWEHLSEILDNEGVERVDED